MPETTAKKKPNMPRPPEGLHADAARTLEAGLPLASVVDKLREAVEEGEGWAVMLWLAYYWGRPGQRARGAAMARRSVREATDEELVAAIRGEAVVRGACLCPAGYTPEGGMPAPGPEAGPPPDAPAGEEQ
jgi:hypothetical protein